jgi:hypothetical protein
MTREEARNSNNHFFRRPTRCELVCACVCERVIYRCDSYAVIEAGRQGGIYFGYFVDIQTYNMIETDIGSDIGRIHRHTIIQTDVESDIELKRQRGWYTQTYKTHTHRHTYTDTRTHSLGP